MIILFAVNIIYLKDKKNILRIQIHIQIFLIMIFFKCIAPVPCPITTCIELKVKKKNLTVERVLCQF